MEDTRSTPLPENYVLNEHDVLCGRGSTCYNHIGNQRFRRLVQARLQDYSNATTKLEKSTIISSIVDQVRLNSGLGGFVKKDPLTGSISECGDFIAVSNTSGTRLRFVAAFTAMSAFYAQACLLAQCFQS